MRYLRQYTKTDCGTIACLNIRKFLGQKATYQDIYKIRREIGHSSYYGVVSFGVAYWLKKNKVDHVFIINPKMSTIKKALCDGYIVLTRTCYKCPDTQRFHCHYALLTNYEYGKPKPYKAVNYHLNETYSDVSYQELKSHLRPNPQHTYDNKPYMWIIKGGHA